MTIKQQIINDIDLLPDHTLNAISIIVKEFVALCHGTEGKQSPVFGSANGEIWLSDDFDEPLEELREYME